MRKYKHYRYEFIPDVANFTIEPESTTMEYITDCKWNVIYFNLNGSGWNKTQSIKIEKNNPDLKFIGYLTKKEIEEKLFIDDI